MKSLPIIVLLLALTVGNVYAQNVSQQSQTSREGELPVQGFENGMDGWTFQSVSGDYGHIIETYHHTGNNCFWMQSASVYGYLISPELLDSENGVDVEFWYTNRYLDNPVEFQVGYSMTTNYPSDFTWGEMLYAELNTNDWAKYENSFPANVKYIAVAIPTGTRQLYVDDFVFTNADCAMPTVPVATPTSQSIALTWTGTSNSYSLRHAPYSSYDFDNDLGGWLPSFGANNNTKSWKYTPEYGRTDAGSAISDVNESHENNYLVSSLLTLGGSMTFYAEGIYIEASSGWKGHQFANTPQYEFKVMVATKESPTINDFVMVGTVMTAMENGWKKYTVDLSGFSGTGRVAICHIYNAKERDDDEEEYKLAIDDITIYYPWELVQDIEATNYTIEGLEPETNYAIQLKGDCDRWTDVLKVKTLPTDWSGTYEFVTNGNWDIASNWKYGVMPPAGADVTISATATIPSYYVARVGVITMSSNGRITISEGGQLKHSNTGVKVKMEKYITRYEGTKDHYQLIAFPVANNATINYSNFRNLANTDSGAAYDLYYFDQNEESEWINHKVAPTPENLNPDPAFSVIENGKGYLYARSKNGKIIFNNSNPPQISIKPSNVNVTVPLAYTAGAGFAGWNLIGNPFACNAYFIDNRPFYRMVETAEGSMLVLASPENGGNVIAPMEGIFVQATGSNQQAVFTSNESQNNGDGLMDFTLRKANNRSTARIDRTRVVFSEGSNMGHLDLMADPNRLYIPIDDKAMAVVHAQPVGELPLNLEVATEGTFVLGFECRIDDLAYCHLIDNLTGVDIDLLQQPEYTFEGRKTDYASRFRVMFATGSSVDGDSFAFINTMGNLSIFGIEGKATVQVIDMLGRVLSSEQFSGSYEKKLNVAPGVYVIRLINGNDVKVQKMIVK